MQINVTYDASVNNASPGFVSNVQAAVQYLESEFTNPVTINIDVGYGEVDGVPFTASQAAGESRTTYAVPVSYSALRSALIAENAPGADTLPATSPLSGTLDLTPAQATALGFRTNNGTVDGYVGFSADVPATYTVEHEITEVMGRTSLIARQPNSYHVMDLFRWSSPGVRDLAPGGPGSTAYFSIDNGATNLGSWNNDQTNGFDLGDWYGNNVPNNGEDAFATTPGRVNPIVSQTDIILMDSIGWITGWTALSISAVTNNHNTRVSAGDLVTITITTNEPVTVTGIPTLQLNDNEVATYAGGSGTNNLTFTYTVQARDMTGDLKVTGLNLAAGASIKDGAGNGLSGSVTADLGIQVLNPTAVMIMNNSNTGAYEIYDIGGNVILAAYQLGQVGAPWSFVGLGTFQAGDKSDMLLRNSSTGAFEAYYVSGNAITNAAPVGTVGTDWNFAGTGNFDGASSLSELLLRNANSGSFELYQVAGGGVLSGSSVAAVGNNFSVKGFGHFSETATTQMMMQDNTADASSGQLELYTYQPGTASFAGSNVGKVGSNLTIVGCADLLGNGMSQMVMQQNNGNFWLYTYNASSNTLSGQLVGAIGSNFQVVGFGPLGTSGQDEMLMQDAAGDFEVYQYNAGLNAFVGTSMGAVGAPWVVDGIAPNATSGGATVGFAPYQSAADVVASSGGGDLQGWIDAQGSSSILTPNSPSAAVAALAGQFGGFETPAVPAAEVPALPVAGSATSQMLSASLFQRV